MKLKQFTLLGALIINSVVCAQDYQIGFTGFGASSTVDSVKVENLTQCTSMVLSGNNTLHLLAQVGIDEVNAGYSNKIAIFPNPATDICLFNFEAIDNGIATIGLYNLAGEAIFQTQELLLKRHYYYQLSGMSEGVYLLKVESATYSYSTKMVSIGSVSNNINIKQVESTPFRGSLEISNDFKNTDALIDMQYTVGDLLKITGKSGAYKTVVMLVPTNSQSVSFNFMSCSDANGNNYAVVQIGNQWWMAENLNAGTYAAITTPQVSGTKFCMDVTGQPDPNCPMGGLYEWDNLLQGGTPCNGSGAPPNDQCSTPVKGLCPNGWHIPSHYEWTTLEQNAGSDPGAFPYNTTTISLLGTDEGGNLKQNCTTDWWSPNAGATNSTGFSGLPGGDTWNGVFEDFGQSGYYWTSTESLFFAWVHALNYSLSVIGRSAYAVESGFSCRCVKD